MSNPLQNVAFNINLTALLHQITSSIIMHGNLAHSHLINLLDGLIKRLINDNQRLGGPIYQFFVYYIIFCLLMEKLDSLVANKAVHNSFMI